jgi:hypothetical protein
MRREASGEASMKRLILVVGLSVAVVGSGVAGAAMLSARFSSSPSAEKKQAELESEDSGIHGGPISRFHGMSVCKLVDVSKLPGNWTHGDYVSAVEGLGDASMVPIAAHSDCGKPMVAVGHGHGPPDFVIDKTKTGQRDGAEPEETPGS